MILTKLLAIFLIIYMSVLGPLRKHLDSLKPREYLPAES